MIVPLCQGINCAALFVVGTLGQLHTAQSGYLSAYAESPTVGTVAYRQEVGDIPHDLTGYDVLIAVSDCMMVGKPGTLYTAVGPLDALVIDCAGDDGTPSWMAENNIVAEIDYWTWAAHPELVGSAAVLVMDGE